MGVSNDADTPFLVQTSSGARRRLEDDFTPAFDPLSTDRHSSVLASPMSKFFIKHAVETIVTPSMMFFSSMVNTATWLYDVNGLGDPSTGDFTVCANTACLKGRNFTILQTLLRPHRNACSESQWQQVVLQVLQSYHSSLKECIQTLGLVPTLAIDESPQVWLNAVTKRICTAKWVCSFDLESQEVMAARARIDDLTYYSLSERIPDAWKPHLRLRYTSSEDRTLDNLITWLSAAYDLNRQGVSPNAMPVQVASADNAAASVDVSKLRADLVSEFRTSIKGLRDNVMALRVMDSSLPSRKRRYESSTGSRDHDSTRDRSPDRRHRSTRDRSPDRRHRSTRDRSPVRSHHSVRDRSPNRRHRSTRTHSPARDGRSRGNHTTTHLSTGAPSSSRGSNPLPPADRHPQSARRNAPLTDSTPCKFCAKEGLFHTFVNCPRYTGCSNCKAMGHCATSPVCKKNSLNSRPGK